MGRKIVHSDQDLQILVDLYKSRCMTGLQIQRSIFGGESRFAQRRIKTMLTGGYVRGYNYKPSVHDKSKSFDLRPGNHRVYELTEQGVQLAESIIGIAKSDGDPVSVSYSVIKATSVGRYLAAFDIFVANKRNVEWIPHHQIRRRLQNNDFHVGCMAGIEKDNEFALFFGVNRNPHRNTYHTLRSHFKTAYSAGIRIFLICCPDDQTVHEAVHYFLENRHLGQLYIQTYEQSQEDLPKTLSEHGYLNDIPVIGFMRKFNTGTLYQPIGRQTFKAMLERVKDARQFDYAIDLSTGDQNALHRLLMYDSMKARDEKRHLPENETTRGVVVLVRDEAQYQMIRSMISYSTHNHVQFVLRKEVNGRQPWYIYDRTIRDWRERV